MVDKFFLRLISSFVLASIFFISFYLGNTTSSLLFVFILIISCYEWNELITNIHNKVLIFIGYFFIISMCFSSFLLYLNNFKLLIFSVSFCIVTDTSGYIMGKKYGKIKCFKNISPNKTLEGYLFSFLFGSFFSFVVLYIIVPKIKFYSLLIPLVSNFGDLFMSYIKRKAGVKDTGNIIPGHGGLLDRIDSWIFIIPFISLVYFL